MDRNYPSNFNGNYRNYHNIMRTILHNEFKRE